GELSADSADARDAADLHLSVRTGAQISRPGQARNRRDTCPGMRDERNRPAHARDAAPSPRDAACPRATRYDASPGIRGSAVARHRLDSSDPAGHDPQLVDARPTRTLHLPQRRAILRPGQEPDPRIDELDFLRPA